MRRFVRWHLVWALMVSLCLSQGMLASSSGGSPQRRSRSTTSRSSGSRSSGSRSRASRSGGIRAGRTRSSGSRSSGIRSGTTRSSVSRSSGSHSSGGGSVGRPSSGSLPSGSASNGTRLGRSSDELKCTACMRDSEGRIARSSSARREFERENPKPGPGYVIDHIIPLKRGGADSPSNMQWQSAADAKAKDKIE